MGPRKVRWMFEALTECGTAAPWQVPQTSWGGLMEPLQLGRRAQGSKMRLNDSWIVLDLTFFRMSV